MSSQEYMLTNFNNNQYDFLNENNIDLYNKDRTFGREITNFQHLENNSLGNNLQKKTMLKSRSQILSQNNTYHPQYTGDLNQKDHILNKVAEEDKSIPAAVSKYAKTIFEYLKTKEENFKISDYMNQQKDINEKMRAILIDWIVDVHQKYKMVPETLFLTIYLIDKYLETNQMSRQKLQLLGITTLFIASKYEEIYPPHLKDFIEITDKSYTKAEVLEMEGKIIICLNFQVTVPSPLRFLDRYARILTGDQRAYFLARYLLELTLVDYKFTKYSASNLACSALYLSMKIYKKKECWSECLSQHSQFKENDVRICAKELCLLLQNSSDAKLQAVRRKYSQSQFLEISKIQIDNKQLAQHQINNLMTVQ